MRTSLSACVLLLPLWFGANAFADTVITYDGRILKPENGSGVRGVKHLHFRLSGQLPAMGTCSTKWRIDQLYDGSYSLKKLLALGFAESPDSGVKICSDAQTGSLSEHLHVTMSYYENGNLADAYTWRSFDPKRGSSSDQVSLYANIEYHSSVTKQPGQLLSKGGSRQQVGRTEQ